MNIQSKLLNLLQNLVQLKRLPFNYQKVCYAEQHVSLQSLIELRS